MNIFKLIIVLNLSLVIYACSGQKSKRDLQKLSSEKVIAHTQSNEKSSPSLDANTPIDQVVRTVFQDRKKNIWFGTESGVFKFNGDSLIFLNSVKSKSGKGATIKDITESKDGKIWIGHTGGISSIDGSVVTNYDESDGLISNDVWCIAAANGNIWVGTIDGVCVFDGKKFSNFELPEGKIDSSLGVSSTKMVHNIKEDRKGTLWFSSNAGLFSYTNDKLVNVSEKVGIQTNFVNEIFEDKKGDFWVSTKKELYNLSENKIKNITQDKIEIGKGKGSIAEDKDGKIWFVSNQHFLYIYDREKLIEYKKSAENKGPVIFQIYKDLDDRLWFVGFGGAYRMENGKFLHISKHGPW